MNSLDSNASTYAEKWFFNERELVRNFGSADRALRVAALGRAAGHFKIARNMPRKYDVERGLDRLAPALTILDELEFRSVDALNLRAVVRTLRRRLAAAYGGKDLLSAATKLLWLSHPLTVVIYDSQARESLGTRSGDYDDYLEQWSAGFMRVRGEVGDACRRLASQPVYANASEAEWVSTVTAEWFMMRVYDMRLWRTARA